MRFYREAHSMESATGSEGAVRPDRRPHRSAAKAILEMGAHGPANESSAEESEQWRDKTAKQEGFSHHSDAGWRNKSVLHRSSTLWSSS
jgi:hypothetical protein